MHEPLFGLEAEPRSVAPLDEVTRHNRDNSCMPRSNGEGVPAGPVKRHADHKGAKQRALNRVGTRK